MAPLATRGHVGCPACNPLLDVSEQIFQPCITRAESKRRALSAIAAGTHHIDSLQADTYLIHPGYPALSPWCS